MLYIRQLTVMPMIDVSRAPINQVSDNTLTTVVYILPKYVIYLDFPIITVNFEK
jgi:hypothetical protein